MVDDIARRVADLEGKVQELDELVNLALRLLALSSPVASLLNSYGATETETLAVHRLLDDVAKRAEAGGMGRPSYPGFEDRLYDVFPAMRGNREFVKQLLEALKVDRPAYQALHEYVLAQWAERPR